MLLFGPVLEVGDGVFEVLSTSGDTHLGGDDFDKVSRCTPLSESASWGSSMLLYHSLLMFEEC